MASASLSRSISSSPTNPDKFTISFWVKRSKLGAEQTLFGNYASANFRGKLGFVGDDRIEYIQKNDGNTTANLITTRKFRDVSAYYNIVVQFDTSQGTASNRIKIYVNGVQETAFDTASYPAQNLDMRLNQASGTLKIGQDGNSSNYCDLILTHIHLADGQTYAPTTFGETDATTGIWKPKVSPSVTYGDDGFFLKMDNSANMGLDSSGNSNNFSTSGTIIQAKDTPSNVFCTLNALNNQNTLTLINNKAVTGSNTGTAGTLGMSKGKYYYEVKVDTAGGSHPFVGFVLQDRYPIGSVGGGTALWVGNGGLSNGDIVGLALDLDNNTFRGYINGSILAVDSSYVSGSTGAVTAGLSWIPAMSGVNSTFSCNFGNGYFGTTAVSSAQNPSDGIGIFEYTVPTNHKAICTKSINAQEYS